MTPEEYADKHERRLTTAHHALMKGFKDGQESFKSSLREEIEKAVAESKLQITRSDFDTGYECALSEILETIDNITPKK